MNYDQELAVARDVALAAGKIQLESLGTLLRTETKPDSSPVTEVDKRCEEIIRDTLTKRFPRDGFLGEESGNVAGQSGRKWIVDPLDGTRPFIRGIPTFSVLIALEEGGKIVTGCIHLPALKETYWACRGGGAFLNGTHIHVSKKCSLAEAMGSAIGYVQRADTTDGKALLQLMRRWGYAYGFMEAYTYGAVAAGRIDVCVNLLDQPWDCAAGVCIIEEAGGKFTDLHGKPSVYNGSVVFTNGLLHEVVLDHFRAK